MKSLYALFAGMIIYGCATAPEVYTDYFEGDTKVKQFKTFAWLPKDITQCANAKNTIYNELYNNQLTEKRIKTQVNQNLVEKGFTIDKDTPDFVLQYKIIVEEKEDIYSTSVITTPQTAITTNPYIGAINTPNVSNGSAAVNRTLYNTLTNDYTVYPNSYYYPAGGNLFTGPGGFGGYQSYVIGNSVQKINYSEGTLILDVVDRRRNELVWRGWSRETLTNPETFESDLSSQLAQLLEKFPLSPPITQR